MERPASPLEVTTATREAASEAHQMRDPERSEAKLRQCFGASVGSGRRSDAVVEMVEIVEARVLELEGGAETRAWRAPGADQHQPSRSRLEPTFVVAPPRPLWESGSWRVVFCVFAAGFVVGGAAATTTTLLLFVNVS